ncbi:MAG: hypothetical protein ABIH99_01795 [Candidatus Micrarchaeota archaeon]
MKLSIKEKLEGMKKRVMRWFEYLFKADEKLGEGEASYLNSYKNILLSSALICYGLALGITAVAIVLAVYVIVATLVLGRPDVLLNGIGLLLKLNPLVLVLLAVFAVSSVVWLGIFSVALSILQIVWSLPVAIITFIPIKLVGGKGSFKAHTYLFSIWYGLNSIANLLALIFVGVVGGTAKLFLLASGIISLIFYYLMVKKIPSIHSINQSRAMFALGIFLILPISMILISAIGMNSIEGEESFFRHEIIYSVDDIKLTQAELPEGWEISLTKNISLKDLYMGEEQIESYKSVGFQEAFVEQVANKPANRTVNILVCVCAEERAARLIYEFEGEGRNISFSASSFGEAGREWTREKDGLYVISFWKKNAYVIIVGEDQTEVTSIAWILDAKLQKIKK